MPKDELAQARQLRDDLRALKVQYPELTAPAAQRRLEDYLRTQTDDIGIHTETKESTMPRSGDRMMGEDLSIVTFRIPKSALPLIEEHLVRMQQVSRWVRLGKSDAQRDIFLRGLDSLEGLPAPVMPRQVEMELPPVEPAATTAGGAIPPAPAYETRAMDPDVPPEAPLEHPLELDLEDTPLEMAVDVTQESVVPEAVRPQPARPRARRQPMPPEAAELEEMPLAPAQAVTTTRPKAAAKPKRTTRTTKGR